MSREGERGRSALSAAAMQSWKGKACLVVGGSGNLGGDLIDLLIERGATVCIFDNLPYDGAHGERVSNHVGDITTDFGRMKLEAACSMMDVVFHMASVVDLTPIPDPRMSEINVKGTLNVIDACVAAEVPTLVYTSIAEVICGKRADGSRVIGTRKAPLDESVGYPAKHTLEYFATKAAAERYVLCGLPSNCLICIACLLQGLSLVSWRSRLRVGCECAAAFLRRSANGPRLRTVVLRPGYFCGAESFALRLEITKAIMYQHNNYIATKVRAHSPAPRLASSTGCLTDTPHPSLTYAASQCHCCVHIELASHNALSQFWRRHLGSARALM